MPISHIGVCYYPEHWEPQEWPHHARLMRDAGIELVRIGEFAWSRIEPAPGEFHWQWLDDALASLANAGLSVIMCTPTACPPAWLIQRSPDTLPVDHHGAPRQFGSRRHYRFACAAYRDEALRISDAFAQRYASHPAIVGWQLDNEYGCHATTRSYSDDDLKAFRAWLEHKHGSPATLNERWGTVFWSQEYVGFDEVQLPNQTVTEANPSHWWDFYRFASDQVVAFNAAQATLLRQRCDSEVWLTHNFMGNFTDFDHFTVGADLDVATWDSYPLGFLDQGWFSDEEKLTYRRIGHPDWAAFHHDLYRAVGRGRFGVMEQQPGPVNWAESNALPLPSAPRFWAMEAIAHGAELVSFFRFQQYPQAQEQMHAALRLSNGDPAPAWSQILTLRAHIDQLPAQKLDRAPVALVFDYQSCWSSEIQPHCPGAWQLEWAFHFYSCVRALGLDVDIVHPGSELTGYRLVIVPGTICLPPELVGELAASGATAVFGPRSASRDSDGRLPKNLAPGAVQTLLPLRVEAVDSMRSGALRQIEAARFRGTVTRWYEQISSQLDARLSDDQNGGFWYQNGAYHYLNGYPDQALLVSILNQICDQAGLDVHKLDEGLRLRRLGDLLFVFNSSPRNRRFHPHQGRCLLGSEELSQGEYAVWLQHERNCD